MNPETKQQIADWLRFFRELGFEDVYRRPQSMPAAEEARPVACREPGVRTGRLVAASSESLFAPAETAEIAAVRPASTETVPGVATTPRFSAPAGAPRSLNLFEALPVAPASAETLEEIRADLGDCQRCKLSRGRKHIVFGQGNPRAELLFIGEGPSADEDEQGLPFVGRAGQLLNKMLQLVGIQREDVYICNIVKCRPPGNRTPEGEEIESCSPFLFRQIGSVRPRLICCLGAPAARTVLGIKEGITKIHGRFLDYQGTKALATVHPAYVLRNIREEVILREDFAKIRDYLKSPRG